MKERRGPYEREFTDSHVAPSLPAVSSGRQDLVRDLLTVISQRLYLRQLADPTFNPEQYIEALSERMQQKILQNRHKK